MIRFWRERWQKAVRQWREDRAAFDRANTDPEKVIRAHYFSAYRNTVALKLPIGRSAASFGVLLIGRKVRDANTVRHEYGHRIQLRQRGFWRYLFGVAIPSVTANLLHRMRLLRRDYYESPWEAEADRLGEVTGRGGKV